MRLINIESEMSKSIIEEKCGRCGKLHRMEFEGSVDALASPEAKEKVKSGEYFVWRCPECGCVNLVHGPFLYHDPQERLMILLTDAPVKAKGLPEGYTGRIVSSAGDLIEKIKIFDAGLDDVAVEMCKFVTLREINKDVPLKFFKMDGADAEMTFTYPQDGQMEMISVGFNVYEDCAGILQRNPSIKEAARGLVKVDPDWLSNYIG